MTTPIDYEPGPLPMPVAKPGEFCFAVASMEHGHIQGMTNALVDAGATLTHVYDARDPGKAAALAEKHGAKHVDALDAVLDAPDVRLVAAAAIPNERAELGVRCMDAGKHYFTDKTPLTSLDQLAAVRDAVARTGKKYAVYYSERLCSEAAMHAGTLIERGAIGEVVHVDSFGPHRLGDPASRPDWFYRKAQYGGILCDIGSHQIEQFLQFAGCKDATIDAARVANRGHDDFPELEDFGDCTVTGDNGATLHFRVDWFTPDGVRAFGDGRTFIVGTEGTIEVRKFVDLATEPKVMNVLLLADHRGEHRYELHQRVGKPYFGRLIRDCLDGTETAMTQAHALKAAELCVKAQLMADA